MFLFNFEFPRSVRHFSLISHLGRWANIWLVSFFWVTDKFNWNASCHVTQPSLFCTHMKKYKPSFFLLRTNPMSSSRIRNLAKSSLMHNVMHRGRKLREEACGLTRIFLRPNAVILYYNCRWRKNFRNMVFIQHIFLILTHNWKPF